jgi:hypothetical protein
MCPDASGRLTSQLVLAIAGTFFCILSCKNLRFKLNTEAAICIFFMYHLTQNS